MIVTRIWRDQPGKFFCVSTKSSTGKWRDNFFSRNELSKVLPFIRANTDKDLYFCPHGFKQPVEGGPRRLKPLSVLPRLMWSDLDEVDPRELEVKPTVAIESSPGRYVGLWVMDKEVPESVNRRFTYLIGADNSGWDLTQVLRIPGTTNYKYDAMPRTRILWSDGPQYKLRDIEKMLPEEESDHDAESNAAEVFKKVQGELPAWCRRELMHGRPSEGKRSEMIWKITNTLIEHGISMDDAFVLLKASPWNKFRGRSSENVQLRREIDKAVNRHMSAKKPVAEGEEYAWLSRSLADVTEQNIRWLWYPYLARGELTILEGDPGLGKSYLAQMVAGHFADGVVLPSIKKQDPAQGRVVYFDIENSAESITIKRIKGAGFKYLENYIQEEGLFSIDDAERMKQVYDAIERVKPIMIVFDTINTYLGKADAFKGHEAQQAFIRFRAMARRFDCAVLVLRHLTKSSKEKALYRGQGSIAFAGIARVVITVGTLPDDADTRAFAVSKLNIGKRPPAHTFRIEALPDTRLEKDRSKFEWGEFVDLSADDILNVPEKSEGRDEATSFLKDVLEEGPVEVRKIERMAEARNIALRTLQRAATEMQVIRKASGFGAKKTSTWSLNHEDDGHDDARESRGHRPRAH